MSSTPTHSSATDWLKVIQEALGDVRKALHDLGAHAGDAAYVDAFKSLRRADQLVADAMRRLDVGQNVTDQELDEIAQLFHAIKSVVF